MHTSRSRFSTSGFFFSLKRESIKALHFPKFSWVSKCFLNHHLLECSIPLIGRGCFPERAPRCSPLAWGWNVSLFCLFPSLHQPISAPLPPPPAPTLAPAHTCQFEHVRNSLSEDHCQLSQKYNAMHMPFRLLHKLIKLTAACKQCYEDHPPPYFLNGQQGPLVACRVPAGARTRVLWLPDKVSLLQHAALREEETWS